MKHLTNFTRWISLLACMLVVAACANLEAVRDFSASSASLTAYKDVTERYLASDDVVLAELPASPDFAPIKTAVQAHKQAVAQEQASLFRLHNVATGYMAALANLAGEGAFDISQEFDQVTGAIVAVPGLGLNTQHVQAYASIAQRVTSWALAAKQAHEVKSLVKEHGPAMDTLLQAMGTVADAYQVELKNEQGRIASFQQAREIAWNADLSAEAALAGDDRAITIDRREAVIAWSRRAQALRVKEQASAIVAAQEARSGIDIVRQGHAEMLRNVDHLSDKQLIALLRKATVDLMEVRANLRKL
jgi:hypothetical protein